MTAETALESVRRRDELLTLLYWLRADRLFETPSVEDLAPFVGETPLSASDIDALTRAGLVEVRIERGERRFWLTGSGMVEAKRRFEEEFHTPVETGVAGNAHEVMVGICGPNARCVKEGKHGECAEPVLEWPSQ